MMTRAAQFDFADGRGGRHIGELLVCLRDTIRRGPDHDPDTRVLTSTRFGQEVC